MSKHSASNSYYYGSGPDMLHTDCGGEVWWLKDGEGEGGFICRKCGDQWEHDQHDD